MNSSACGSISVSNAWTSNLLFFLLNKRRQLVLIGSNGSLIQGPYDFFLSPTMYILPSGAWKIESDPLAFASVSVKYLLPWKLVTTGETYIFSYKF